MKNATLIALERKLRILVSLQKQRVTGETQFDQDSRFPSKAKRFYKARKLLVISFNRLGRKVFFF